MESKMKTLEKAKDELFIDLKKGSTCPCCEQYAKEYKTILGSSMVRTLIWLNNVDSGLIDWVHVPTKAPKWVLQCNNIGKLVDWGLVASNMNTDKKKRTSGQYKITLKGVAFVDGLTDVPKYRYTYNNKVIDFSEEMIDVREALTKKFDYTQLMSGKYE